MTDLPGELELDDSPSAAAEGNLGTVGDDEFFGALEELPPADDGQGQPVDLLAGVMDERPPGIDR
jgi:hypothetical protein